MMSDLVLLKQMHKGSISDDKKRVICFNMEDNLIKHCQLTAKLAGHQGTDTEQWNREACQSSDSVTVPKIVDLGEINL